MRLLFIITVFLMPTFATAQDYAATVEAIEQLTAAPTKPPPKGVNCDCGGPCKDCPCTGGHECLAAQSGFYWAYDPEMGGWDLCTKTRVVGYWYPSGYFMVRRVGNGFETWTREKPPIDPPVQRVSQVETVPVCRT